MTSTSTRLLSIWTIGLAVAGCGGRIATDVGGGVAGGSGSGEGGRASPGGEPADDGFNDRCVNALGLDLTTGAHVVIGDSSLGSDEYAKLDCESLHVAGDGLSAAQLYYRVPVDADSIYRVTLRPTFYGFVYVVDAALGCGFESLQAARSSDGVSGDISHIVNPGTTATFEFELGFSGDAVLAVDSDTSAGPFELEIQRL